MSVAKRRRHDEAPDSEKLQSATSTLTENAEWQDLLRQHFEDKFEPLQVAKPVPAREAFEDHDIDYADEGCDTDWTGLSEGEDSGRAATVVDHQRPAKTIPDISKQDAKMFMTSKPPVQAQPQTLPTIHTKKGEKLDQDEEASDAANLKKDVALQRLLKESHLLDPTLSLVPSGQERHKAMDIRQQALGSKSSVFYQKNMPLAQRRGIAAKAVEDEAKRRQIAKESGIILEKATKLKQRDLKRERGIGAPGVGKFSRGMLTLSKKDVTSIVGPPRTSKRKR
ncbi:MAG: hypothetical protein Q9220_004586 [cf. Caloplaca sp. 1 TL-2023]